MVRSITRLALGIIVSLAVASTTRAATKSWNGGNGNFAQGGLWSPSGVPGAADQVYFSAGGGYTVTFNNSPFPLSNPVLNQDLSITGGNVTFTSGSGGPYTYRLTGNGGDDVNINNGTLTLGAMGNPLHMTIDDDLAVRNGTTFNVRFGSVVNTLDLLLAQSGGGSGGIFVNGTGSQLNVSSVATQSLGLGGGAATLWFSGSSGSFSGPLEVGVSSDAGTVGVLNVDTGAQVNIANLAVGSGTAAGTTGTVNINGSGSTVIQSGAATLTVGAASGGSGAINIGVNPTGGTLTTGSGLFTINKTGTVTVGSATTTGTLNANGDVTIDGGVLQVLNSGSNFLLAAGKTFTVQNGGRATFDGIFTTSANAIYITDASFEVGLLNIDNGAQVNVNSNAALTGKTIYILETGTLNIGSATTYGLLQASQVFINGGVLQMHNPDLFSIDWLTVRLGGRATFDLHGQPYSLLGHHTIYGTNSKWEFVDVLTMLVNAIVEVNGGGLITVDGDLGIGSSGLIDVSTGGTLTANSLVIYSTGKFTLGGGTLTANAVFVQEGGTLDFVGGALGITGAAGLTLSDNSLGTNFSVNPYRTLNVTNATTVPAGSSLALDGGSLNTGSLVVNGAFSFNSGTLVAGSIVNNGALTANNTAIDAPVVNNNAVTVLGTVNFNGPVSGSGDFLGLGTAHFNGGLAPGASTAEVSFAGSLALADTNTLFIEIGGITPGSEYDRLTIAGSATLDGYLNVSLINGFPLTGGQQFTILTASSIINNGLVLGGPAASSFNLIVSSTSVILQAISAGVPGDYNQSGAVDAADYVVWRKGLGTTYTQTDYDAWRAHFGQTGGSGAGANTNAAVPEPATLVLLMFAAAIWCLLRRRVG